MASLGFVPSCIAGITFQYNIACAWCTKYKKLVGCREVSNVGALQTLIISDDSHSCPCGLSVKKIPITGETNNQVMCSEHFKVNVRFGTLAF